jgi:hypothetical protein
MGVSQIGGTSYSRVITKQNTAGATAIGSASVTGNGATSAWGQISASLTAEQVVTSVHVAVNSGTFSNAPFIELGIGGSGSETVVAAEYAAPGSAGQNLAVQFGAPVRIAVGQRVVARITDTATNSAAITLRVVGAPYANLEGN